MRTSGRGERDLLMMSVPLSIFIVYGVYAGGGVTNILRTLERTLWAVVEWAGQLL
jgi:hypothetical protein